MKLKSHILYPLLLALPLPSMAAALPGMVHHWNFDEGPDWHDSPAGTVYSGTTVFNYGSSSNATLQNMGAGNWVSGRQYTALSFNGSNQFVNANTNLASTLGGTMSFSFWVRTTQVGTASSGTAPGIAGATASGGLQLGWLDNTGRIGLSVDNNLVVRSAEPINDNRWHHILITRSATSGAAQIHVDGQLSGSATGPVGNRSTAFSSLGRLETGGASGYYQGRLDQVHVFNQVVSAGTVSTLFNNHAPKTWPTSTEGVNNRVFTTASVFSKVFDVERNTLSVASFTQPAHGSVTHNGDGSFNFTTTGGYIGADSFTVVIEDGQGGYRRTEVKVEIGTEPAGGATPTLTYNNFSALKTNGTDISHNGFRVPRGFDWNKDGKTDLLVGHNGAVWLYLNTGTTTAPSFGSGSPVQAGGVNISGGGSGIALADLTGDGVLDLIVTAAGNKLAIHANTAAANAAPVFAAATFAKDASNADLVLSDGRFDVGDWDGDGRPDIVTGAGSGNLNLYMNTGTATAPRFAAPVVLFGGSYNLYPRLFDLDQNGSRDLIWGVNWGGLSYWRDAATKPQTGSGFVIRDAAGAVVNDKNYTEGIIPDFADFNGDGRPDLLMGGHAQDKVLIAYAAPKTVAQTIADLEAIYDANSSNLGAALSANDNALLGQVRAALSNLAVCAQVGTLGAREDLYNRLAAHVAKYPFLKYQQLDTSVYHHVPSIALQNWMILAHVKADTPSHRTAVANVMGLTGSVRSTFLESKLTVGDNATAHPGSQASITEFMRRHPRELFPDGYLTLDHFGGDGRGAIVWGPNGSKNTFNSGPGPSQEWRGDLYTAIDAVLGQRGVQGDGFTFVLGHEGGHSLDGYVRSRANKDLEKRWGLTLCTAGGADIIPGANGWIDWTATKNNFQAKGYWNGVEANWNAAWDAYWATGPGAVFRDVSFMRGNIGWFFTSPQESLATQCNQHWISGAARLVGAVDRFRQANQTGVAQMKANINEVVTFMDFQSAGLNRINLFEVEATSSAVTWTDHYAELERNDQGYITRITHDGYTYDLTLNANGVVTDVTCSIVVAGSDFANAWSGTPKTIDVGANDYRLDGKGAVSIASFTQGANGSVSAGVPGQLVYTANAGFAGTDTFTYTSGSTVATVTVKVTSRGANDPADSDNDGFSNSLETALGTNPNSSTSRPGDAYSDLRAWWKLDEASGTTAIETVGYTANNGTLMNAPARVAGRFGNALSLNGSNQYVSAPFTTASSNRYTIACWIKRNGTQGYYPGLVFSRSSGSGLNLRDNYELGYHWAGTHWGFGSGLIVPDGVWTFCALSVEANKATLYMQPQGGALQSAVNYNSHAAVNFTNVVELGADSGVGRFFKGEIDDCRIYTAALSGNRIAGLARGNRAPSFAADPIAGGTVPVNSPYNGSLTASDPDDGDTLTYAKVSGPAWLNVAGNGILSGMPGTGNAGANAFVVRVTDAGGEIDEAVLNITVQDGGPSADNDGDGFSNGLEQELGTDPNNASSQPPGAYSGLRGWWRLNEGSGSVAADITGASTQNGTLLNSPAWVAGASGNAVDLNGTNQSVRIPALGLTTSTMTMSGWIKRNGNQVNYAGIAFMRGSASGLNFLGTTNQLGYHWNDTASTYNFVSNLTVPDGVWTFVGVVVEPTQATLYLQPAGGVMQTIVNPVAHGSANFNADLYLGQDPGSGRFMKGAFDEFRLYTRALSAAEMQQAATASLPSPWQAQDIGAVGVPGSQSHHGGAFAISGSGNDIWDNADGFRFAYQSLSGDGSITARLISQDRRNGWDKAGVMIRESLSPGSVHAIMAFTPDYGFAHQYRGATGGGSTHVGQWSGSKPAWLRLTRTGNVIRAYSSADGTTWTQRGGDLTLAMAANIQIGLAVSSHNNGEAGTAVFDNVTVVP